MRKALLTVAAVAVLTLSSSIVAVADHTHWLLTPGTCVLDIASGQTSQSEGGGYHRFHRNVHIGTPGTFAFAQSNNPVSVGRNGACPQ
jgi:hypothetical protein